jgi:hypothetical protein
MMRQFRENTVNPTARKKSRQKRTHLRLRKEVDPFLGDDGKSNDDSEPVTMGLDLIDVLFSMFDIRGHIPDSHRVEAEAMPVAIGKQLLVVTAGVTGLTLVVAPLAAMVWLAIRYL